MIQVAAICAPYALGITGAMFALEALMKRGVR